jgi:hypothetical protein
VIPQDFDRQFEYENGFYLTAPVNRISKFVTHLDLFRRISGLPGEVVECGVFKGVSFSRWIKFRSLLENPYSRRVIGFDTFGPFPEAGFEQDKKRREQFVQEAGDTSISTEEMGAVLDKLGLNQNVQLVKGDVTKTAPAYVQDNPHLRIALLHVDVDLLEPTRACLDVFYPHVVSGGIIVLDDYGAFAGANSAIESFFADKNVRVEKLPFSNAISFVTKP